MTNDKCKICGHAHEAINGRYCRRLKMYVEYAKVPPCQDERFVKNGGKQ